MYSIELNNKDSSKMGLVYDPIYLRDQKRCCKQTMDYDQLISINSNVFTFKSIQIKWENRFAGQTGFRNKVTVDGTDFRIREPSKFNRKWFSHKFRSAGLRYEVAVCIKTGFIVWIHGPLPCGSHPDITVFRSGLKQALVVGERVEADRGYRGEPLYISVPDDHQSEQHKIAKSHARARHEQINRRFKQFQVLHQIFRHDTTKHAEVFWAVAVITQLSIELGDTLVWPVNYTGERYSDSLF